MNATRLELEKKSILRAYTNLLRACKPTMKQGDRKQIRLAFEIAVDAHKEMRRKSGEPYILHPLAVAQIVAAEIGLGPTAVICALLHDVVEDTEVSLADIEKEFGKNVAEIIDGLTKIKAIFDVKGYVQAENIRKILLTMAKDVRVILIKLADRLHNMRTMDSMPRSKQLKITSETLYLYVPLAHRLGLYAIKSELEDLAMKYNEPKMYREIALKLQESKRERNRYIAEFTKPLRETLSDEKIKSDIYGRPKSISSIWRKMQAQGVPFEEVYDKFAVRIIVETPTEEEKADCWKVYSIVTDKYLPNPDRLRDWISTPKANGYEALHTTVMGPRGKWVEVQIRSARMNEIAEKGYAAHWKYKEKEQTESALDDWLRRIREHLENPDTNTIDFIDDFKLNLFAEEMYIFTPTGEVKIMPANSTILDFAFEIHSALGSTCIGAKVNQKIVPVSHVLSNGDQVEILTSRQQTPSEEWLNMVVTAKAKTKIKDYVKSQRKHIVERGKKILEQEFAKRKIVLNTPNLSRVMEHYKYQSLPDLYYAFGNNILPPSELDQFNNDVRKNGKSEQQITDENIEIAIKNKLLHNANLYFLNNDGDNIDYALAECCKPIPGDDVFGFINKFSDIEIHRANCPKAVNIISKYGYKIVKTKWTKQSQIAFLTGLKVTGIDDVGVMFKITNVISGDMKINMQSISIESKDGIFEGTFIIFVNNTAHLMELIERLRSLDGILNVARLENPSQVST